ncbi:uncharacterized protein LOC109543643 isoform X2 [Dendroctonus ponderosae]|uniref:uncharacterized protein LOC109543643 isoform X2 n=1 Tax=Dendroctonus ponderosae TaxID=77166 RepID=UPI002035338D|nr:uncharacterized protein LOC109543643 isoform X2 [Dendroctonus ponderosae]KAH1023940.1 hypothetical protein HUJ05_003514 [Dendroctonus ponderosae]
MPKKACCVVPHCRNSSEKTASLGVTYQKFPTKDKTRRRWVRATQASFPEFTFDDSTTQRMCSEHFEDNCFMINKNGKEVLKLDAVPTIFNNPVKKEKDVGTVRPRHQSRRAASKEALKQMQILLEDEDDAVEIPDDDEPVPVPAVVPPPKKKYKLSHRKSSDGNGTPKATPPNTLINCESLLDREVLVLKSITPSITNHDVENNLELECWVEELEPCQKERNQKLEEENKALQEKLDELIKGCDGEVIYTGDLTTVIEVAEHVQKTIQAVQTSQNKPPIVLNSTVANSQPYQLVVDPRIGLIVGSVASNNQTSPKPSKIQVTTNLQTPVVTPGSQTIANRNRLTRTKKQTSVVSTTVTTPPPLTPVGSRSVLITKSTNKRIASQSPVQAPPATRSRGNDHQPAIAPTPPVTRSRPGANAPNNRPSECNVEGGLTTGLNVKSKAIVDLTADDGRPLPDSREISFNKLQGKTFPSLVVVARPHLRVSDVNSDRSKLDAKVKSVLLYLPSKFTEWLIQQGLIRSEQTCTVHSTSQLKLGMYSDVTKFPYSGGYVWISECCPQRFISVFSGSIFEGSQHPPLVILKIIYHWACQTNIQNVTQWVRVDNLYVKGMYTWLRSVCTLGLQTHIRKLGGPQVKVEVGVISLGTTSQDGNSRQVKVEVLGILECNTKLIRLRAIEPLADGERNYKKRFAKILEPLEHWVHPSSVIITDLTVDKGTLLQMGFATVMQPAVNDCVNSNKSIMDYLRRIVPRMFQNTLSLLSRQIIQQFLDELVWREWFGTTSMQAFDNLITHLAEQTRFESSQSLVVRLHKVAVNPFRQWVVPVVGAHVMAPSPAAVAVPAKPTENLTKKRKRKDPEQPSKPTSTTSLELNRPPKSTSPDVPEQMIPLENYYYGTIDNYPPKTNVTLNMKCPFCKEVFNNNIILMNHLFKHAHNVSKDGQMCRYCLTSLSTANDLLKHIATSHPSDTKHDNGFICLICETQYMNPFVLGKHMSKEHCPSELPYQCGTCGYRCSNHKQAIDHFHKQHDNGPTIQCPFCLKSTTVFSSSRNIGQNMHYFIQHLQKHQKKQFARRCGKCNLWFVQKEVLKEHQYNMHASQRGKSGLVPWVAPRNGVMVPKSKMDKYPCDGEGINFGTLICNVSKGLKCKECDDLMDSSKHFPSFESCQHPNCQYSTCCSKAMQNHNAKCSKNSQRTISQDILPYEMFCICGYSSLDGNQMAKHLATCEKKSAYPSLSDAKSASVTHSMLDVLGLVRKPEETDKKVSAPRSVKRAMRRTEAGIIALDEDESSRDSVKSTRGRKSKKQLIEAAKKTETEVIDLIDDSGVAEEGPSELKSGDKPTAEAAVENVDDILAVVNVGGNSEKTCIDKPIILEDDSNDSSVTTENVGNDESDVKSGTLISNVAETEDHLKPSDSDELLSGKDLAVELVKENLVNDTDQDEMVELPPPEKAEVLNANAIPEAESSKEENDSKEDSKDALDSEVSATVDNSLLHDTGIVPLGENSSENTELTSKNTDGLLVSDSLNVNQEGDTPFVCSDSREDDVSALKLGTDDSLQNIEDKSDSLDVIESITAIEKCLETSLLPSQNDLKTTEAIEPLSDIVKPSEQTRQADESDRIEENDDSRMEVERISVPEEPSSEVEPNVEDSQGSKTISTAAESGTDNTVQLAAVIADPVTAMEVD